MGLYLKSIALFVFIICIFLCIITKKYKYILSFLIFLILFYTYTIISENNYKNIYETYGNKEVKIQGIIVSNPEEKEYKNVYEIRVTKIEDIETKKIYTKNFNLLCNVKKENDISLNYGDKIEFIGKGLNDKLRYGNQPSNYIDNEYMQMLFSEGIVITVCFTIFINILVLRLYKLKKYKELIICTIYLTLGLINPRIVSLMYCPILFLLVPFLFQNNKEGKLSKNEKVNN